jgi:hypothetical protein
MTTDVEVPRLEQPAWFDGQLLTADDLTTAQTVERELRWLHNRALHDWGIVTGFGATGNRGDRAVSVAPGMALDRLGREIILAEALVKNIPVTSGKTSYYLIARYQQDSDQEALEARDGVCANGGAVRLSDRPRIEWRAMDQIDDGLDIILGSITIVNCKLSDPVAGASRRPAKPPRQPQIASGSTDPDTTAWSPWSGGKQPLGFTTDVDTSDAGFQATPQYIAQIVGDRYLAAPPGPLLVVPVIDVLDPRPDGFRLAVALPAGPAGGMINPALLLDPQQGPGLLQKLSWRVSWIAVES